MLTRLAPALLFVAANLSAQQPSVPLYNDLGSHHRAIGTRSGISPMPQLSEDGMEDSGRHTPR